MARKKTNVDAGEKHKCGECARGTDVTKFSQLNIKGEPICVRCAFSEYSRLKSEYACGHFKKKI